MNTVTTPAQAFANCAYREVREKQVSAFTSYLDKRPSDSGYVANLNGAWGTGKTFFVNNWVAWLRERNYVAIKIDAWESDYLNDPLAIVTAEMLSQLKKRGGIKDFAKREKQIIDFGWKLAKNFLPVLTMALGRHFLGEEYESLLKEVGLSGKDTANDKTKSKVDFDSFGKGIFETHDKHKEFVEGFKTHLGKLVQVLLEHSKKKKVYVFIDELDRCRPTYAIEMLEVVKHLFDIPNLVFILSTDTNQLECSIKAIYGERFDSEEYLSRFFQRRLTLSKPDYLTFLNSIDAFANIEFESHIIYPAVCRETARELLSIFCECNDISFRRAELLCTRIEAALISLPESTCISYIEVVGNIFCYELYSKFDFSYNQAYIANQHNLDNKNYKIKQIQIVDGSGISNVFDEYQRLWNSLVELELEVKSNQRTLDKEKGCNALKDSLTAKFGSYTKFDSFSNIVKRHQEHNSGFSDFYDQLFKGILHKELNLLSGKNLHQYLHLFDDFS